MQTKPASFVTLIPAGPVAERSFERGSGHHPQDREVDPRDQKDEQPPADHDEQHERRTDDRAGSSQGGDSHDPKQRERLHGVEPPAGESHRSAQLLAASRFRVRRDALRVSTSLSVGRT